MRLAIAGNDPMVDQRAADRIRKPRRRSSAQPVRLRPCVEVLDARRLLTATAQLPTGQYLNALQTLVTSKVDTVVGNLLADYNIPGMAVAITYQGSVILDRGYGYTGDTTGTDVSATPPVTVNTPFDIGSVTKTFTAISILKIIQDPSLIDSNTNPGITSLQLDAPISTYLPAGTPISLPGLSPTAPTFTLPTNWGNLTTRELLSMESGVPDVSKLIAWNDVIAQLTGPDGTAPLEFSPPGSYYYYSDTGFNVLGALIEKLTNMTYAGFVQQEIFTPLGMDQSTVLTGTNTQVAGEAVGYNIYDATTGTGTPTPADELETGEAGFASGNIVSTGQNLGAYLAALWNQSPLLLDLNQYQSMWTPVTLTSFVAPSTTWTPGLGWDGVDATNEGTFIYKNGAVPGYQAQINLYTTEGFGVAVAFNHTLPYYVPGNVNAGTISTDINDALLRATAEVSGSVTNGSGGAPESGWQVYVDENYNGQVTLGALSTTTNSQGFYSFPAVPPGDITIRIVPPNAGWAPVSPTQGTRTFSVSAAQAYDNENFVVAPAPRVTDVTRTGTGRHTAINLTFSEPLDETGATNTKSYRLIFIGPPPFPGAKSTAFIRVQKAIYNPTTHTVTLKTRRPLALARHIEVEVIGSTITSAAGVLLDGNGQGRLGSNFTTQFAPGGRRPTSAVLSATRAVRMRRSRPTVMGLHTDDHHR